MPKPLRYLATSDLPAQSPPVSPSTLMRSRLPNITYSIGPRSGLVNCYRDLPLSLAGLLPEANKSKRTPMVMAMSATL